MSLPPDYQGKKIVTLHLFKKFPTLCKEIQILKTFFWKKGFILRYPRCSVERTKGSNSVI